MANEVGEIFKPEFLGDVEVLVDVDRPLGSNIKVIKDKNTSGLWNIPHYWVLVNDVVRHPKCDAEAVIRALGMYLTVN